MNRATDDRNTDPFSGLPLLSDDALRSLGSMEAIEWEAPPAEKAGIREIAPGIALAAALIAIAFGLHGLLSGAIPLSASVLAMVLGITLRNALPQTSRFSIGCRWIVARLIPVAIVLIGAGLDLRILMSEGLRFLGYILAAVLLSTIAAILLGRLFGVKNRTALLIGAGTGICGSSAILAIAPVIDAEEDDILLSVGAINLIGLIAMFACVGLASVLPIPAIDFGILTGTTIHAVPTVSAAAFDHSMEAGEIATLVKMGRVALLVPFVFAVAILWKRKRSNSRLSKSGFKGLFQFVPWFVWGFAATAALGTLGLIPDLTFSDSLFSPAKELSGREMLSSGGKLLLTLAMAAIGLQVGLKSMLQAGGKAVSVAAIAWGIVAGLIFALLRIF